MKIFFKNIELLYLIEWINIFYCLWLLLKLTVRLLVIGDPAHGLPHHFVTKRMYTVTIPLYTSLKEGQGNVKLNIMTGSSIQSVDVRKRTLLGRSTSLPFLQKYGLAVFV